MAYTVVHNWQNDLNAKLWPFSANPNFAERILTQFIDAATSAAKPKPLNAMQEVLDSAYRAADEYKKASQECKKLQDAGVQRFFVTKEATSSRCAHRLEPKSARSHYM